MCSLLPSSAVLVILHSGPLWWTPADTTDNEALLMVTGWQLVKDLMEFFFDLICQLVSTPKPAACCAFWLDDLCSNELFASTAGNVGTTLCDHSPQLLLLPGCWSSLFLPRWSSHTCWAHLSPSTMTRTDHIIRTFNALLGNVALNTTTISPAFAFHSSW